MNIRLNLPVHDVGTHPPAVSAAGRPLVVIDTAALLAGAVVLEITPDEIVDDVIEVVWGDDDVELQIVVDDDVGLDIDLDDEVEVEVAESTINEELLDEIVVDGELGARDDVVDEVTADDDVIEVDDVEAAADEDVATGVASIAKSVPEA